MAARELPPFRADHVGSLLRPPDLLDARARHRAGDLDDDGLREVEDAAIRDVVALQKDTGLRTATDGEFRRTSWHMDFIYQLEGVDPTDQKLAVHFHNKSGDLDFEADLVVGELLDLRLHASHSADRLRCEAREPCAPTPRTPAIAARAVRARGLEPPRACAQRDLNPPRLPVPPRPRSTGRIEARLRIPRRAGNRDPVGSEREDGATHLCQST